MDKQLFGKRIKALRGERRLSQENLAEMLGFNDRQTVSAIETGTRRVTAEELVLLAGRLETPLEYFTDPFLLVGEGRFSWRQANVVVEQLEAYERKAGRWIAGVSDFGASGRSRGATYASVAKPRPKFSF